MKAESKCLTSFFLSSGLPIASASAPTVEGLRQLLREFEAEAPGCHVSIVDLREELVIYVKGTPYVLREIDFATKSLNLAGISAEQVSTSLRASQCTPISCWWTTKS